MADFLEEDSVCFMKGPLKKVWVCRQAGSDVVECLELGVPSAVYDRISDRVQGVSRILNALGGS